MNRAVLPQLRMSNDVLNMGVLYDITTRTMAQWPLNFVLDTSIVSE